MSSAYIKIEISSSADINEVFRLLRDLKYNSIVENIEYEVD